MERPPPVVEHGADDFLHFFDGRFGYPIRLRVVRTGFDVIDGPFFAEVIELVLEPRSAVAVNDDRRAVGRDEESDEICDLFCSCVFSAFEDVRET